jgi:membrane-bound inhibitor of C-type lysozyme
VKKYSLFIFLLFVILLGAGIWFARHKGSKVSSPVPSPLLLVSPSQTPVQITYTCKGGKTINAVFYTGELKPVKPGEMPIPSGSVKLVLSDGRKLELPQTISADGGRYANSDESFVFWSKGDGAIVLENNVEKNYTGCVVP